MHYFLAFLLTISYASFYRCVLANNHINKKLKIDEFVYHEITIFWLAVIVCHDMEPKR